MKPSFLKTSIFLAAFLWAPLSLLPTQVLAQSAGRIDIPDEGNGTAGVTIPGATVLKDVAYGTDKLQRFDVYIPPQAQNAPIIVMAHGGGWFRGDKAMKGVVQNKATYWLAKGYIFVSTNYRFIPEANPVVQSEDVYSAVQLIKKRAVVWGGNPDKLILMGHSAGAHLVALLSVNPKPINGKAPWKGTVVLDSGSLNVPQTMTLPHFELFDNAFGKDPKFWVSASPYHQMTKNATPILSVCSEPRRISCMQSNELAAKAKTLGVVVKVQPENLTHAEINKNLGLPSEYTKAVDRFIQGCLANKVLPELLPTLSPVAVKR